MPRTLKSLPGLLAAGLALSALSACSGGKGDVRLVVATAPSGGTAGEPLAPAVTVRLEDAHGARLASGSRPVTLSLQGAAGAVLLGTTTAPMVDGEVTFAGLSVEKAGEGYTLVASSPAIDSGTSAPFAIGAAAPSAVTSTLTASPASAPADGTPIEVAATVRDRFGNVVPGAAVTFASDGPAFFTPPVALTASAGVATSSATATTPSAHHVTATVGGVAIATASLSFLLPDRDGDAIANANDAFPDDPAHFARYATVLLPRLPGGLFGAAVGVNDARQVVGLSDDGTGALRGVTWNVAGGVASPAQALLPIAGNGYSAAYAIGSDGSAVGESAKGAEVVAVAWAAGQQDPVELLATGLAAPSAAYGTGGGRIVGEAVQGGHTVAVLWNGPALAPIALGTLGGATSSALFVTAGGRVVGESVTATGARRGVLWTLDTLGIPGAPRALDPLPGHVASLALAVSASGAIVGESESATGEVHAVTWPLDVLGLPGAPVDLGVGSAAAVNAAGRIAGASGGASQPSLWDVRNPALGDPVLAGAFGFGQVYGMNAAGWLAGLGDGQGFVAVPQ